MEIKKIFIVGSGLMGSGIAHVAAQAGYQVTLCDVSDDLVKKAIYGIDYRLERKVIKGNMTPEEKSAILGRLSVAEDISAAADADLVIEAITENVEAKKELFRKLVPIVRKDAILASNTSTISITTLSSAVENKDNFVGLHFFSPVPVMKLLEIVVGLRTSQETLATVKELGSRLGKVTIVARDSAGFIVNRMLDPMINEAIFLVDEGASPDDVDNGMKYGCNHTMGPLETADMSGLDVLLACMEEFYRVFGDSKYRPAPLLRRMVDAGYLGRKSGRGFYRYDEHGKKII